MYSELDYETIINVINTTWKTPTTHKNKFKLSPSTELYESLSTAINELATYESELYTDNGPSIDDCATEIYNDIVNHSPVYTHKLDKRYDNGYGKKPMKCSEFGTPDYNPSSINIVHLFSITIEVLHERFRRSMCQTQPNMVSIDELSLEICYRNT